MTIDGIDAGRIIQPQTIDELSQMLASEKQSVVPIGGSTQLEFGNPLRRFDCGIDLTKLNRVTEYVPGDLTIHFEAGMRVNDLQRLLEANNQFLPLDPWNDGTATIGGIAAANAQGSYRAVGTIRDWIIGMKVVEIDGRISKTGGRVVKNVTGYDLAKLYTGSIGTLAIIAEISLKVRARYGRTATAIARFANVAEAGELLSKIRKSELQPVSWEWLGPENEVWLRFGEHPSAVEWQLKNLPPADWRILEGDEQTTAWQTVRDRYSKLGSTVIKVIGLPASTVEIVNEIRPQEWIAHAANGIVLCSIANRQDIRRIREKYRVVIERAPLAVRREVPTFGLNGAELDLMLKMKKAFDPDGRLNPGRHVDGE